MSPFTILAIFIVIFLLCAMCVRLPVPLSMGIAGFTILNISGLNIFRYTQVVFNNLDNFAMLAMPYFIFAGALMEHSGISDSLLSMIDAFIGRMRGRLGAIVVLGSMAFGVLTGATMATLSAIGGMMIGPMRKYGYDNDYIAAIIAASSFLGVLIPPSVPGIMYATTANLNVSDVWLSTLLPGIILGLLYIGTNFFIRGRREPKDEAKVAFGPYVKNAAVQTKNAFWALLMPVIIFGGIYGGIVTPTEAGAVSAVYGVVYYIVKKFILRKEVGSSLFAIAVSAAGTTGIIGLSMALSGSAGRVIALSGIGDVLANFIRDNISSPTLFLFFAMLIFYFLGTFIDHTSSILIMTPLLMPSVNALNINPYHFGSLMLVTLSIGQITPPYAGSLYLSMKMTGATFVGLVRNLMPFFLCGIIVTCLIVFFPFLATLLI